ncbi:MAG: YggS family pyridoxal phosphate enzyme [Solirubrobacterales bacterium]|nr:YggS family pyridoxal phosphate enzyme [Solirubrobacterales bacterium]
MVDLIRDLEVTHVRAELERVREEIDGARGDREVEILAAVKYIPAPELLVLAEAGLELLGENRAQDLAAKADAYPGRFTWDFIGHLQSRKVRQILPYVRYIHSVASDSALAQLARHGGADTRILVEVNVAEEAGKSGIAPRELPGFLDRAPVPVVGLMTMPPLAQRPEDSRPYFAALRHLAERHSLPQLSMGTSQDYLVAVQEGATIVRLGTVLYQPEKARVSGPDRHNQGRETGQIREP